MASEKTNRRDFIRAAAGVTGAAGVAILSCKSLGPDEKKLSVETKQVTGKVIRVGMIGCDTSHCGSFIKILHDENAPAEISGVRVTAAYPSFSPDLKTSYERVDKYKKMLAEKWGVKMTGSIEEMLDQVDAVMLESVDGRRHLNELKPVARSGKPVYIDKPFTASLADAKEMVKIIKEHNLPAFSSSSLRFDSGFTRFMANKKDRGKILGCDVCSPAYREPTNPGLFWYGIHGVEILYTIMGQGCKSVRCTSTKTGEMAVGTWSNDRLGTLRGIRKDGGQPGYGARVVCEKASVPTLKNTGDFYKNLMRETVKFFKTKKVPVAIEETLEICAFIDAAWRSEQQKGAEVKLAL